jgi:hypothetical protein
VEAWMGTLDEVDFCPPIYLVRYIFFFKREGVSEGIVVRDKNRDNFSP